MDGTVAAFSFEKNKITLSKTFRGMREEENKLKIYQNVIDSEDVVRENYDIMQLSSPQMSVGAKTTLMRHLKNYIYNQAEVRKLMIRDVITMKCKIWNKLLIILLLPFQDKHCYTIYVLNTNDKGEHRATTNFSKFEVISRRHVILFGMIEHLLIKCLRFST